MTRGVLALLGSGETAPGMTKIHRDLLAHYRNPHALNLNTAYGFQENVTQMSEKLTDYFRVSLGTALETVDFTSFDDATALQRADVKRRVRGADYVFAGPGSPSYALAQWQPLGLAEDLRAVLEHGGTLCFSSAAALTLGAFTAPIYEIYKVGATPYWLEGLDVMAVTGLSCAVVPHFDNAEGGNHDTSRCYLGARRLERMIDSLPSDVHVLGVDEHTAVLIDLERDLLEVRGRGSAYWITDDTRTLANGSVTPLEELRAAGAPARVVSRSATTGEESLDLSPRALAERVAKDPSNSLDALSHLAELAERGRANFIDPSNLIDGVLRARRNARDHQQFALADELRDALLDAGVEVQDGPDFTTWSLRQND